jgi:hypothetical protein
MLDGANLDGATLRRASLLGASLDGTSLSKYAELQSAVFAHASLRGAVLDDAQLEGASFKEAQLQGASLDSALLHGADVTAAQLQGASLKKAGVHGACVRFAHLEGASLEGASLLATTLVETNLTGASLANAQLQGASLGGAVLNAADLSNAALWRASFGAPLNYACEGTTRKSTSRIMLKFPDALITWQPFWRNRNGNVQRWDDSVYQETLGVIKERFDDYHERNDPVRDTVLNRLGELDCLNSAPTLASCDPRWAWVPPLKPLDETVAWRNVLEAARVDDETYTKALARVLQDLVCSGDGAAIYVVRGGGFQDRLEAARVAASRLINDLANKDSKDCPVSASLTDTDRAKLLQIKQGIEKAGK